MGINNIHGDTISALIIARDVALATVRELAAELRSLPEGTLADLCEADLCEAMEIHAEAENAVRLAVDGYAETHPHPAGSVHPGDAYAAILSRRG
jgi:hypothetical protein